MIHVAIVEDSATQAHELEVMVRRALAGVDEADVKVTHCATGKDFLGLVAACRVSVGLVDIKLPDISGLELIEPALRHGTPTIMVTSSRSVDDAIEAIRRRAMDYVTKPVEPTRLQTSLRNAIRLTRQAKTIHRLRSDLRDCWAMDHLVGSSDALGVVRTLAARAGNSDITVLVTGETGTGKELVARALHFDGPRRDGPFVDVNSAGLSDTLIASELFGHEKGAFTGADRRRKGKFEQAAGGTLFLDEIGDMPLPTQARILRVLQERSFYRTGGEQRVEVDVRVICATHRDLEKDVADGRFRRDLYYRISAFVIHCPALRERPNDVLELTRFFLARSARKHDLPPAVLHRDAAALLLAHAWPGNVRELEHALERAVLLCDDGQLMPDHLPCTVRSLGGTAPSNTAFEASANLLEAVEALERSLILDALQQVDGIKAKAARRLGITTRMISYKMVNLGLQVDCR